MLTWCIYDISNNKRRKKTICFLEETGLERVQYSVFLGDINLKNKEKLFRNMKQILKKSEDSLYLFSLSETNFKNLEIIGKGFKKEAFLEEKNVMIF